MKGLYVFLLKLLRKIFGQEEQIIHYIFGSETLPQPMSATEEACAMLELSDGVEGVKARLIERNLRLVVYIARKFNGSGVDIEDLTSIGTIGLIKAVNSFDPDKKIKLATYASRCIENEILMYLRRIVRIKGEVSIDEPLNVDWEGNELLLGDILGTEPDIVCKDVENKADNEILYRAIGRLNPREKAIMNLRFGLGGHNEKTQKEVADLMGISQSYISRLEKKIISRLRKEMEPVMMG